MQKPLFFEILNEFYKEKKWNFYLLIFSSLFAGLCELLGLVLIFQFILFLSNPQNTLFAFMNFDKNPKTTLIIGLSVILVYILKNLYMIFYTKLNNNILEDLNLKINLKILNNLLFQDFLTIKKIKNEEKSTIFSKINITVWEYTKKCIDFSSNILITLFLVAFLFFKFTLCAMIISVFVAIFGLIEYKILKKKSDFQNKNFSKTLNKIDFLIFSITNYTKEIKLNNKENIYLKKINHYFEKYANLNKEKNFNSVFHIYFTEMTIMLTFGIILTVLYYSLNFDNQTLLSSLCTICIVILRFAPTINRIQSSLYIINSNKKTVEELLVFNKQFKKIDSYKKTNKILNFQKAIELKNVSFSYENEIGLENINLKINKNDFIAIVGKSGSYKTTLALILAGLIAPQKGELIIDGNKISENEIQKWQNNISFLSQDFTFLNENIENNNEELFSLLKLKNGALSTFSTGEKQRIALAKTLKENKEVLILDEITSNQDVITQEKINNLLAQQKQNKTIIAITHRFSLLKHATKIIFLDENTFDFDTYENLKNKHKNFQQMIDLSNTI